MALGTIVEGTQASADPSATINWAQVTNLTVTGFANYTQNFLQDPANATLLASVDYWVDYVDSGESQPNIGDTYNVTYSDFHSMAGNVVGADNTNPDTIYVWAQVIGAQTLSMQMLSTNQVTEYSGSEDTTSILYSADYWVNLTLGGQTGIVLGYLYTPSSSTFAVPPADGIATLRANVNAIQTAIVNTINQINSMQYDYNIAQGLSLGLDDVNGNLITSPDETVVWEAIQAYLEGLGIL